MPTKRCTVCGEEKDLSEFSTSNGKRKRIASSCKACNNAWQKLHYALHGDEKNAKARAKYVPSDGTAKIGRPRIRTDEDIKAATN